LLKPSRAGSPLGHHQRWWWPSGEPALLGFNMVKGFTRAVTPILTLAPLTLPRLAGVLERASASVAALAHDCHAHSLHNHNYPSPSLGALIDVNYLHTKHTVPSFALGLPRMLPMGCGEAGEWAAALRIGSLF